MTHNTINVAGIDTGKAKLDIALSPGGQELQVDNSPDGHAALAAWLIAATPHEILTFTRRGTGKAGYERLKAALDRLQSTSIATSIRQAGARRRRRFSWINEWRERLDDNGRALGIEMIVPDWLYEGVLDRALVLTIDPAYFALTGGLERWLYRIVRKHGGNHCLSGIVRAARH